MGETLTQDDRRLLRMIDQEGGQRNFAMTQREWIHAGRLARAGLLDAFKDWYRLTAAGRAALDAGQEGGAE